MRPVAAVWLVALAACGRSELDVTPPTDLDAGAADADACLTSSGVRLCGGPAGRPDACPALPAGSCLGYGCTGAFDFDGHETTAGICWADTAETDWLCDGCSIGDGCLQRSAGEWVCVPIDVCAALWNLGVRNVCRYADKERYDHRPMPAGAGCPEPASTANSTYFACGGDCSFSCGSSQRCNGVAPDHPFGLCNCWYATACIDAERRFHRVRNHKGLAKLAAALRAGDQPTVAAATEAA